MSKKKKPNPLIKFLKPILVSVIVVPIIAFSWKNMQAIWASPERVDNVEKKVQTHEEVQSQISRLVVEQQARLEKQDAVYTAQVASIERQLELIAQLKKK